MRCIRVRCNAWFGGVPWNRADAPEGPLHDLLNHRQQLIVFPDVEGNQTRQFLD
jgi:hypothetical protein